MRLLVAIVAFVVAGQASALDPATFQLNTGAKLVELCGLPAEDPIYGKAMEFCNGYLVGAYQYYDATEPASNRFVCAPNPRPALSEVMQAFVAWAKVNPQYLNERPVDTLFRFLAKTYPCSN